MLARAREDGCLSDLRLDLLLSDEMEAAAAQGARGHLAGCRLCAARLAELEEDRRLYRATRPALERPARQPDPVAARPRVHRWLWPIAAAATVAALFLFWPRPAGHEPGEIGPGPGGTTRIKGRASIGFHVKRGGVVSPGASGETVRAGDSLRFDYTADRAAYLVVASRDPAGRVSVYHPAGPRAERVEPATDRLLPDSILLDDAVGTEVVYGLFCESAVEVAAVRAALETGNAPALPGCQVDRLVLDKRPR
jgi:hypothetical protein